MPKNTPEKIAELYLRLNGFFVMSHFVMLSKEGPHRHIDLVALRLKRSQEIINGKPLKVDKKFFEKLGVDKDEQSIAVVVEVKGGEQSGEVNLDNAYKYLKPVVGPDFEQNLKKVVFCLNDPESKRSDIVYFNLKSCLRFILQRLKDYSREKIGDLIYLRKLGFLKEGER